MKHKTHKPCKVCGKEFKLSRTTDKYCSSGCMYSDNKEKPLKPLKSINKVSKKQTVLNAKYTVLRIEYLGKQENKICPITGNEATTVHHKKGRLGYADEFARLNDIPLLLDIRFWIALSMDGHDYVERNPQWAKDKGYTLSRIENGSI